MVLYPVSMAQALEIANRKLSFAEVQASSSRQFICQGERSGQFRIAFVAHAVFLSAWQEVHGFGTWYLSVVDG